MLAGHFLGEACRRLGVPPLKLKQRHVETLRRYNWPGNVRELQNIVERAVIRAQAGPLEFDLPGDASSNQLVSGQPASGQAASGAAVKSKSHAGEVLNYSALKQRERENLLAALEATHWRISGPSGAAKLLGLRPTTLASKIKVLGLREE